VGVMWRKYDDWLLLWHSPEPVTSAASRDGRVGHSADHFRSATTVQRLAMDAIVEKITALRAKTVSRAYSLA
jgi:hypothetical protein